MLKSPKITVPLGILRKLTHKLDEYHDDFEVSFEMVMVALFPNVWKNIQKYGSDCHIRGYLEAKEEYENKRYN